MSEFLEQGKKQAEEVEKPLNKPEKIGKSNPPKDTRWAKGQSGNYNGRPPLSPEMKQLKDLSAPVLKRLISKHWWSKQDELSAVIANPDSPAIDVFLAKTVMFSIEKADPLRAEFLFKRSIGNVQESIKIGVKSLGNKSLEDKIKAGRAAIEFLEAQKNLKPEDEDEDDEDDLP